MKAIVCKYLSATNHLPTRIKATASDVDSITITRDNYGDEADRVAAHMLCEKYGWDGELIKGTLPNGDVVFVFAS